MPTVGRTANGRRGGRAGTLPPVGTAIRNTETLNLPHSLDARALPRSKVDEVRISEDVPSFGRTSDVPDVGHPDNPAFSIGRKPWPPVLPSSFGKGGARLSPQAHPVGRFRAAGTFLRSEPPVHALLPGSPYKRTQWSSSFAPLHPLVLGSSACWRPDPLVLEVVSSY